MRLIQEIDAFLLVTEDAVIKRRGVGEVGKRRVNSRKVTVVAVF